MANIDGFKSALEALQGLDAPAQARILQDIAQKDPQMAKKLREGLFVFSDLQYMLPADFKVIWWECPREIWHLALRKVPTGVMKMVESHLSKRAFSELLERIKELGPRPASKVIEAQNEICDLIRELGDQGRISMPGNKKNDPMV